MSKVSKGTLTQNQIIDASIMLFAKNGYERTSFQMIANQCNISQVTPLYHFKSKFGLFVAIVKKISESKNSFVQEQFQKGDDPRVRLAKFMSSHTSWVFFNRNEAKVLLLLYYFASIDSEFTELNREMTASQIDQMEEYLISGRREGLFVYEMSSSSAAEMLSEALTGQQISILTGSRRTSSPKAIVSKINTLIGQFEPGKEMDESS